MTVSPLRRAPRISLSEIAELAGVRRPVVTTWRRRHPGFPAPVAQEDGRPLFDPGAVVDWLVTTGRAERREVEPDLHLHLLGSLDPGLGPRRLAAATTALICLAHLDGEPLHPDDHTTGEALAALRHRAALADPDDALLRTEIHALPEAAGALPGAVDALIDAAWGCPQAYERLLAARRRLDAPALYADAVSPRVAALVAGLSGAAERAALTGAVRVTDPTAGPGDLVRAVLDLLDEDADAVVAVADADPFLARLARRRLAVRDAVLDEFAPADADVLVTQLPYQAREDRAGSNPLAPVERIADGLTPGQTAVVLGPAEVLVGALKVSQPAFHTRAELLASGRVEAVILLPGGAVPFRPAYQTAIWVLRHDRSPAGRGRLLLADVSDRELSDEVVEALIWDVTTWRRDGHHPNQHHREFAAQVDIADLLGREAPLTTRRPRPVHDVLAGAQRAVAHATDLAADLAALAATPRPPVPTVLGAREPGGRPIGTDAVGALVREQRLILVPGARIADTDLTTGDGHPVLGAEEVVGARRPGDRRIDRVVFAERYPRVALTEPGDVVVTLAPRFATHVDHAGYAVVRYPARVLRVPPVEAEAGRMTPRVLAALLATGPHTVRAAGAVRAATRLEERQVLRLPPDEVRRLDALLAAVEERRALARRELDLLDDLRRLALTGLADGTLTTAPPP